jgi:hypothetical protein
VQLPKVADRRQETGDDVDAAVGLALGGRTLDETGEEVLTATMFGR